MDTIRNEEKLPITVIGGCHNSQFNVSMIYGFLDGMIYLFPNFPKLPMWCYGTRYLRRLAGDWYETRMVVLSRRWETPDLGMECLVLILQQAVVTGGSPLSSSNSMDRKDLDVLGQAYQQTLTSYVNTFDMTDLGAGHPKSVQQWVLLGDPSLKIGGYE